MSAVDFAVGPSHEIVISGSSDASDVRNMAAALARIYAPNKVVVFRPADNASNVIELVPYTKQQLPIDGKATAYVCRNFACELPTTEINEMLRMLAGE